MKEIGVYQPRLRVRNDCGTLYHISRNRKAGEVVVELTPGEIEYVIDIG
jgi:hypothetical protein